MILALKGLIFSHPKKRILILIGALVAAICGAFSPLLQRTLLSSIGQGESIQIILPFLFGALFFGVAQQAVQSWVRIRSAKDAVQTSVHYTQLLYRHSLHLSFKARHERTVGDQISLYTQDISAITIFVEEVFPNFFTTLFPVIIAPIAVSQLKITPYFPLLFSSLAILGIEFSLAIRQSGFFLLFKKRAEERIAVIHEWLLQMRALRVLGWTEAFEKRILAHRVAETENRVAMVTNGSILNAIAQFAPVALNAIAIFYALKKQHTVTPIEFAAELVALLWIINVYLTRPLRSLPWTAMMIFDTSTSYQRFHKFLDLSVDSDYFQATAPLTPTVQPPQSNFILEVKELNLSLGSQTILKNLDLNVRQGEFIAIVGEVGSGKSLLLQSLLRLTPATFTDFQVNGINAHENSLQAHFKNFGYVPQESFILSTALSKNVSFQFSNEKTNEALSHLKVSQFDPLAEQLTEGLYTEVGERGVTLSGGQRQRVSIARASFTERSILLLDDCFSAIDQNTEIKLIESTVLGEWKNKTRILITHRLSVLKYADRVLELKDGRLYEIKV